MTSERWKQIERLYHGALDRASHEQAQYLADACGGDEALRAEVESLLGYHKRAADFIELARRDPPVSPIGGLVERVRDAAVPGRFAGHVFGSYEVKSLIAAGGMGEVYRAIDTRLDRVVAIKILPPHLSDDPDRRERFTREAKIISSLNHPNICALYDVGVQDDTQYLVMEHIDGETLQDGIRRGPVPLARAVEYLIQVADALDKAHRRGIVHRDLKPGNIMLTKSGVKLLDFGLAARRADGSTPAGHRSPGEHEQTLTARGVIMGTVQYMAPEQLQGRSSDARTDIFAFGAVAHEMITGRRAFEGETQAALIGAILRDEPQPILELMPEVSPAVARLLTRCLAKDPDERWQTANDLLFELRSPSSSLGVMKARGRHRPLVPRWLERAVWLVAIATVAVGAVYWVRGREVPAPERIEHVARVEYPLTPAEGTLLSGPDVPFAVSPNGRYIAYVMVGRDETSRLAVQSLASGEHKLLSGTDGASTPFWSPDGEWIGFFAANSLKKVRLATGLAQTITHDVSTTLSGASWSVHDDIVFPSFVGSLTRVRATGGPWTPLNLDSAFSAQFLPDGRHILYAVSRPPSIRITSLDAEPPRTLMTFPVRISPIAYASGHVFFIRDDTLYARPFDEHRVAFSGNEVPVVAGIPATTPARAPFSVSNAGVLAYWTHPLGTSAMLQWFDRTGHRSTAVDTPRLYRGFDLSADGTRLVFSRIDDSGSALWIRETGGANETRLTFDESYAPQLSPEGDRVLFSGPGSAPPPKLFLLNKLPTAESTLVATTSVANFASGWSGDGRSAITVRIDPTQRLDVWHQLLPNGPQRRLPFNSGSNESQAKVSPDNRWIAFVTDRSGQDEVWVAGFPSGDDPRPLSLDGGSLPQWTARGKEIVYLSEDKRLIAVPFDDGVIGRPEPLFAVEKIIPHDRIVTPTANAYVATADGQRFLVAERAHDLNAPPIKIVVNWRAPVQR